MQQQKYLKSKIVIELQGENSAQPIRLEYAVFDHDFGRRWLGLIDYVLRHPGFSSKGSFYGAVLDDEEAIVLGLKQSVETINEYCSKNGFTDAIIKMVPHLGMNQAFLNDLHGIFEKLEPQERFRRPMTDVAQDTLNQMNLLIHRAERFTADRVRNNEFCIDVITQPVQHVKLLDDDFKHFTLDWEYGGLYITYGITGVPTMNAFWMNTYPRPQDRYTAGLMLAFYHDHVSNEREAVTDWLKREHGVDASNPKCALGFLQVGCLANAPKDQEEFAQLVKKNQRVTKIWIEDRSPEELVLDQQNFVDGLVPIVTLESLKVRAPSSDILPEARWPFDTEIFYHLDLVPYLDLKIDFDAAALLEEAKIWQSESVVHRAYSQDESPEGGKWKSIGLRALNGDPSKTLYHWEYGIQADAQYDLTEVARLCPKTMAFLNRITDVSQCERVRFMFLEPGAAIHVHKDSTRDVSLAVNISLNMPKGCVFWAQVNADGTENEHSVRLPFRDTGSVLLFNNAKYHRVHNDSDVCRVHIILHGPIRFSDDQLLNLARAQNRCADQTALVRRLVSKKAALNEPISPDSALFKDWVRLGLQASALDEGIGLMVVNNGSIDSALAKESLESFTEATLFPLDFAVCKPSQLVEQAKVLKIAGKTHLVCIGSGTFIFNTSRFTVELNLAVTQMRIEKKKICGHIMDFQDPGKIPYLHEQFCIIDLAAWQELNWIPLGELFSPEQTNFPSYEASIEKNHGNYTPNWLQVKDGEATSGESNWGTAFMAKCLERGWRVHNVSSQLREVKTYAYALQGLSPQMQAIRKTVQESLQVTSEQVFYINNEPLKIVDLPGFEPTQLISVAAGFKPAAIYQQFAKNGVKIAASAFIDFSGNAIAYMKGLVNCKTVSEIENWMKICSRHSNDPMDQNRITSLLRTEVLPALQNEESVLIEALTALRSAEFRTANFVTQPESLVDLIRPNARPVIWVSNAFYNRSLFMVMSRSEALEKLNQLYLQIAQKLKTRCWSFGSHTAVFGESPLRPIGLITDGCSDYVPTEIKGWIERRG